MSIHWKAVEQYFALLVFYFTQFVILEKLLSTLDLALPRVKGLMHGRGDEETHAYS